MALREPTPEQSARAYDVLDLVVANPDGVTWERIDIETDWVNGDRNNVYKIVQVLRDMLAAQGQDMTVTCDPDPDDPNGPWLYRLMGGQQMMDTEQTSWPANRIGDAERRILSIKHTAIDPAVKNTSGRTMAGKRARIWQLHIQRAQEELSMLDGDAGDVE